jgi:hypothetical protein
MQTGIFAYGANTLARPGNKATTEDVGLSGPYAWDIVKRHFPLPKYKNRPGEKETLPRRAFKVVV